MPLQLLHKQADADQSAWFITNKQQLHAMTSSSTHRSDVFASYHAAFWCRAVLEVALTFTHFDERFVFDGNQCGGDGRVARHKLGTKL
mmetsp:Transcript_62124/g.122790  ORF Transcript_62124/g.122790 Transcript_62124/m.122790 type:complete len:88 (+) Transcript_62124:297-560(+)